jgi:hypothetical protein
LSRLPIAAPMLLPSGAAGEMSVRTTPSPPLLPTSLLRMPSGAAGAAAAEAHTLAILLRSASRLAASDADVADAVMAATFVRQHTSAYVSIRQHASAYVSIRQHTDVADAADTVMAATLVAVAAAVAAPLAACALPDRLSDDPAAFCSRLSLSLTTPLPLASVRPQHTSAYVSIRRHTSAYVSIRRHTSAYVGIRRHTSAYVGIREHT